MMQKKKSGPAPQDLFRTHSRDRMIPPGLEDTAAMKQAGIAYATEQIIDLMANGVNNIHIYTMNKPDVAHKIMEGLSAIIHE